MKQAWHAMQAAAGAVIACTDAWTRWAWGQDELRPISCRGHDSQGGMALTLTDALDALLARSHLLCVLSCANAGHV